MGLIASSRFNDPCELDPIHLKDACRVKLRPKDVRKISRTRAKLPSVGDEPKTNRTDTGHRSHDFRDPTGVASGKQVDHFTNRYQE